MPGRKSLRRAGSRSAEAKEQRCCGLCSKTACLVQTECCGHWICDDEDDYVMFSYARNSCHRNHRRLTLCGYHHAEEHEGQWQVCEQCCGDFEAELYVYYGTNEYNFEKLENPPAYEPTTCATCGSAINLGEDGFSTQGGQYFCEACSMKEMKRLLSGRVGVASGAKADPNAKVVRAKKKSARH